MNTLKPRLCNLIDLQKNGLCFGKLKKMRNRNEQGFSCIEIQLSQNSIFLQNAAKEWKFLATGSRIHGPLNWVYIVVMSMGKYHLFR